MKAEGNLLHRIWQDIKNLENLDLYVVLFGAVIVILLDALSIPLQGAMNSVILAVLGLVTLGILGNRWRLEQIKEAVGLGQPTLLDHEAGAIKYLAQAHEVWFCGVSRHTTVTNQFPVLEALVRRGGQVRVLVIDPRGPGAALAVDRFSAPTDESRCQEVIWGMISELAALRACATDKQNVQVRLLNFVPAFALTLIDPKTPRGIIQVTFYNHSVKTSPCIPQLLLAPGDHPWYDFYHSQMTDLWAKAGEWDWSQPVPKIKRDPSGLSAVDHEVRE